MWGMSWHTIDASSQIACITTHLFITMCILIISSMNNSLAAEEVDAAANVPNMQAIDEEDPLKNIDQSADKEDDQKCWLTEAYEIKGDCLPCNEYRMKLPGDCCGETGYRQKIFCKLSEKEEYMSCARSQWEIEKGFWTFEGVMLAIALCSGFIALLRRRKLDWTALERVRKQIANSV